jgi:hypothetical protein
VQPTVEVAHASSTHRLSSIIAHQQPQQHSTLQSLLPCANAWPTHNFGLPFHATKRSRLLRLPSQADSQCWHKRTSEWNERHYDASTVGHGRAQARCQSSWQSSIHDGACVRRTSVSCARRPPRSGSDDCQTAMPPNAVPSLRVRQLLPVVCFVCVWVCAYACAARKYDSLPR